jgi:hypothetical protein
MIIVLVGTEVFWLDKYESRKCLFILNILEEPLYLYVALQIFRKSLSVKQQRTRKIVVVDPPRLARLLCLSRKERVAFPACDVDETTRFRQVARVQLLA